MCIIQSRCGREKRSVFSCFLNVVMVSSDQLKLVSSFAASRAEKEKIQERDSASQYKGATKPRSDADRK